jgi:glycosyltransferase involved in cell wall biosynthesis
MRVAIVHSLYSSSNPSGENDAVDFQIEALKKVGLEVELFARRSSSEPPALADVINAGLRVATGRERELAQSLADFRPDLVHVHNMFPNFGTSWMKHCPVPIVTTLHNFRYLCAKGTLFRSGKACTLCPEKGSVHGVIHRCYRGSAVATLPLAVATRLPLADNPAIRDSDHLIALSNRFAETMVLYGLPAERLSVLPNFFPKTDVVSSSRKRRWSFVGRLDEDKGVLDLIRAWPFGHHLDIFGDGPARGLVEQLTTDFIHYCGLIAPDQVPKAISASEALIFPSRVSESAPTMVYMAALSVGRPVIALSGNAVADDISEGGSGLVLESLDRIEEALHQVSGDSRFRENAERRFSQEFSESVWTERILSLYETRVSQFGVGKKNGTAR